MLHGIQRERTMKEPGKTGGIQRVVIRYTDGRTVNVMPDAKRKTFSEDDAKELRKVFDAASSTAEWAELSTRSTM